MNHSVRSTIGPIVGAIAWLTPAPSAGQQVCSLDATPQSIVRIAGSGPHYEFNRIGAVVIDAQGGVVVANSSSRELRYFDAKGVYLRTAGRRGQGPGEFSYMTSAVPLPADSIAVLADSEMRISLFSPAGQHVRDIPLGAAVPIKLAGAGKSTMGLDSRRLLGRASTESWIVATGSMVINPNAMSSVGSIRNSDSNRVVILTPGSPGYIRIAAAGGEEASASRDRAGRVTIRAPLFPRNSYEARISQDEVAIADGAHGYVQFHGITGRPSRRIPLPFPPRPATRNAIDAEIAAYIARGGSSENAEHLRATVVDANLPSVSAMVASHEGTLWLERWKSRRDSVRTWYEVSADGALRCTLPLPQNQQIHAVRGDRVALIVRDDLDVETVEVRKLVRGR